MEEALRECRDGSRLHVVNDGEAAIGFLRHRQGFERAPRPDLIFLDLNLPRRDGREVLADIKSDEELKRIPVVVLTTSEAERDVKVCYDLHANCYVKKPIELDRFLMVIRECQRFWSAVVRLPAY